MTPATRPASRPASLLRDATDARALLAYVTVALVLAFVVQHPLAVVALCAAVWLVVAGVLQPAEYLGYLAFGGLSALGVMLLNPLVSRLGTTVLWTGPRVPLLGVLSVSAESVLFGVVMGLRLFAVVGVFALCSALLDPDALYRLVAPLSIGSALVTALSIRLFPATARDAQRVSDALRSRGLPLDRGSVRARVSARVPVVSALLMSSLDRAMSLAESLEARGYGRAGRSRMRLPRLSPRDVALLGASVALAVAGVAGVALTAGYRYYPVLDEPARLGDAAIAALLGVLAAAPLVLEWGWSSWRSSRSQG